MAKSTRAGGPSFTPDELADPHPPVVIRRAMLGGEPSSVGTHSLESSENEQQSSGQEMLDLREPVQTTENPSPPTEGADSVVDSTDGDGQTEMPKPFDEMSKDELKELCREYNLPVSGTNAELIERLENFESQMEDDDEDGDI